MLEVRHSSELNNTITGEPFHIEVIIDTNGIGRDLGLEMVVYQQEDGKEKLSRIDQFKIVKQPEPICYGRKAFVWR